MLAQLWLDQLWLDQLWLDQLMLAQLWVLQVADAHDWLAHDMVSQAGFATAVAYQLSVSKTFKPVVESVVTKPSRPAFGLALPLVFVATSA